ncbi:MAG: threonylcarbamoyl-AMP synthase [Desulfocapsa sp.]|nr:threonylcarbamoyl-AMP synthase [Desulfocapsa sp.]
MPAATSLSELDYQQALVTLQQGGVVAYPTETFYGLAVDPENDQAIAALYALKKRERQKKLSLLVPNLKVLSSCTSFISIPYQHLIEVFWPGPLTLVFPAKENVFPCLTGEGKTLAIRISSHPIAAKLCLLWGRPLTATSANVSGETGFVTADQVRRQWGGKVGSLLDGGKVPGGQGSTIVCCTESTCRILRTGVISEKEIAEALPDSCSLSKSSG